MGQNRACEEQASAGVHLQSIFLLKTIGSPSFLGGPLSVPMGHIIVEMNLCVTSVFMLISLSFSQLCNNSVCFTDDLGEMENFCGMTHMVSASFWRFMNKTSKTCTFHWMIYIGVGGLQLSTSDSGTCSLAVFSGKRASSCPLQSTCIGRNYYFSTTGYFRKHLFAVLTPPIEGQACSFDFDVKLHGPESKTASGVRVLVGFNLLGINIFSCITYFLSFLGALNDDAIAWWLLSYCLLGFLFSISLGVSNIYFLRGNEVIRWVVVAFWCIIHLATWILFGWLLRNRTVEENFVVESIFEPLQKFYARFQRQFRVLGCTFEIIDISTDLAFCVSLWKLQGDYAYMKDWAIASLIFFVVGVLAAIVPLLILFRYRIIHSSPFICSATFATLILEDIPQCVVTVGAQHALGCRHAHDGQCTAGSRWSFLDTAGVGQAAA